MSLARRRLALTPLWSIPVWLPLVLAAALLALAVAALVVAAEARVVERGALLAAFPPARPCASRSPSPWPARERRSSPRTRCSTCTRAPG